MDDLPSTIDGPPPPRRTTGFCVWPRWGQRTYHAVRSTNAAFSALAVNAAWSVVALNALFCLLAVNGLFAVASLNSVASVGSLNSLCSAFSRNCFMCIGCSDTSWCRGTAFGGVAA